MVVGVISEEWIHIAARIAMAREATAWAGLDRSPRGGHAGVRRAGPEWVRPGILSLGGGRRASAKLHACGWAMLTIHAMPNLSVHCPNSSPHICFSKGIVT